MIINSSGIADNCVSSKISHCVSICNKVRLLLAIPIESETTFSDSRVSILYNFYALLAQVGELHNGTFLFYFFYCTANPSTRVWNDASISNILWIFLQRELLEPPIKLSSWVATENQMVGAVALLPLGECRLNWKHLAGNNDKTGSTYRTS